MTFDEIPGTIKAAIAIGILAIGGFTYHDQFITEAEASESSRIAWIRDLEAEIRQLKRLKRGQTGQDAEQTQEEIEELQTKVQCIRTVDEDKVKYC